MRTAICAVFSLALTAWSQAPGEWPVYGRDPGGTKYSPLEAINRGNVSRLRIAWTFRTGDMYDPQGKGGRRTAFEATPLFVDGTLYVSTPLGRVIALDPDKGTERWSFDPKVDRTAGYGDFANRGVAMWTDSKSGKRRIYIATIDARLFSLDAAKGKVDDAFGTGGQVNLKTGLRNPPHSKSEYEETSPPAVIGDVVIVGSAIADNGYANAASGEVRAFDVRTGKLRWTFDPMAGQKTGAANAWSIISVDPERNLVFVPTGSASPDYYGGERPGNDLYANCVVALRADTGKVVWHFQTVHHDLWDYDVASQPTLFTWRREGMEIPAIAIGSKTGNLFILNRETGAPVFGVEERPVPKSDVAGESAAATQPFPVLPEPLVPQRFTAEDAWGATEADRKWCAEQIARYRSDGIFTPPTLRGSLFFPGNVGGMAWGGAAYDPEHGLLVIPTNRLAALVRLIPREQYSGTRQGSLREELAPQWGTPYGMSRQFLLTESLMPCNRPPWGALTAIDVSSGKRKWETPLGVLPWLADRPEASKWGSLNLGGPIVTGGGLVFIGATLDAYLRAFDVETGSEVWKGKLPTSARATPMTYSSHGKQYVVIAAGGHDVPGVAMGDYLVAFALE
jgi:quinoprotein glucose dehydrogenase